MTTAAQHPQTPPPWWRRAGRWAAVAVAWALVLAGTAWVVLGSYPELQLRHPAAALASSFIPYGVLAWLLVTVVVLTSPRRLVRLLALLSAAALVLQVGWTRPYWPREPAVANANLTVMALNTYYGWADPDRVVAEAERVRPDVVVLGEITQGTLDALQKRGWNELMPHHLGEPGDGWESHATMVFARYPLRQTAGDTDGAWATLEVATPGGSLTVVAVHAINPAVSFDRWQSDLAEIGAVATARARGPLVVLGDFNAVREHQPLRELLDAELADAAEQAGAGWMPTWPSRRMDRALPGIPYPPVIGIDHVLVGPGISAAGFHTFIVDRTDHLGVVARLDVTAWPLSLDPEDRQETPTT